MVRFGRSRCCEEEVSEGRGREEVDTYLVCVYASIAPPEPRTNAGKMSGQYLLGLSANARRIVAMSIIASAARMSHFELMTREREPVKDIENARTPIGIMCSALEMADHP